MSDSSKGSILVVTGVFIPVCTIVVALRFYARYNRNAPFKSDDWCMLGALLSFLAYAACALWFIQIGWIGHGSYPFPGNRLPEEYDKTTPVIIASDIVLWVALGLVKISSLLLYASVFCVGSMRNGSQITLRVIRLTCVIVGLWIITASLLVGFQCKGRFKGLWQPALNEKYCNKAPTYFYAIFLSDLILDVWVILIPIPLILRLHMNITKKLQITGVFMIALVGVGASCARLAEFLEVSVYASVNINPNDPEQLFSLIVFFNILETAMILISINMPVVWGLLSWINSENVLRMVRSMVSLSSSASKTDPPDARRGSEYSDNRSNGADTNIKGGFHDVRLVDLDATRASREHV